MYFKLLTTLLLAGFLGSCTGQSALWGTYGTNGERLALLRPVEKGKFDTLEIVTVTSGKYAFTVQPEPFRCYSLALLDKHWNIPLLLTSDPLKIDIPDLQHISMQGETQTFLNEYTEKLKTLNKPGNILLDSLQMAKKQGDETELARLREKYELASSNVKEEKQRIISRYANDPIGVYLIWKEMTWMDYETLEAYYLLLDENMRNSEDGLLLSDALNKKWSFKPGSKARDFTLNDVHGNPVSLFGVKAKVKMIDFWASWCNPCRMENKLFLEYYKRYKDKGFEIIGVSLDKEPQNWKNAITKDGCNWIQLIDVKGKNSVYDLYKGSGVPHWYILDENNNCIGEGRSADGAEEIIRKALGI